MLLDGVFLSVYGYKFNAILLPYGPTLFQKGSIVSLTVLGWHALKKRPHFRRFWRTISQLYESTHLNTEWWFIIYAENKWYFWSNLIFKKYSFSMGKFSSFFLRNFYFVKHYLSMSKKRRSSTFEQYPHMMRFLL